MAYRLKKHVLLCLNTVSALWYSCSSTTLRFFQSQPFLLCTGKSKIREGDQNTLQRKRSILTKILKAEKKSLDENIAVKTPKTMTGNKGIWLCTLLPVKSSFTMSNILIDKTVVQDLLLGDKGSNIGEAHAGLYKIVRKHFKEDPMSIIKPFFDIEWFEMRTKK
jgi:hypothetical protein